jgi:hypothetical protein
MRTLDMPPFASRTARAICLSCAALAAGPPAGPESIATWKGSAYSYIGEDELRMRLALGKASSSLDVGLETDGKDLGLGGGLSLASSAGGSEMIAGLGSVSGIARVLVDPTAPAALSLSDPVALDPSLESRSSVLGLRAGPLSLFGIAYGAGISRELEAAAAGLAYGYSGSEGGVSAIAAASYAAGSASLSGWRPDPAASPGGNMADGRRPCLNAALVAERHGYSSAAIAAIAASYGRLAGPGLALRLDARETAGAFTLRVSASAAASSFRELAGPRQERLFDACAEARIAMRRASSLSLSVESQAWGASRFYAPALGRKGGVKVILPLGGMSRSFFETRIEADSPPEGEGGGSWSIALARRADECGGTRPISSAARSPSSSMSFGGSLKWDSSFAGLELSMKTEVEGEGGLPSLGLDASLDLYGKGRLDSPVLARGGAHARFPFGPGASIELDASLPEKGIALAPSRGGGRAPPLVLCLRYRASFP